MRCHKRNICISLMVYLVIGAGYYLLMASLENANIALLLVGPFITGISGGFATVIMATFRYVDKKQ